jgi:hypothetical protein
MSRKSSSEQFTDLARCVDFIGEVAEGRGILPSCDELVKRIAWNPEGHENIESASMTSVLDILLT